MPTIDVSHQDLNSLVGKDFTVKELREKAILFAKAELESVDGDTLKLDIKDTNRPDLWSVEGVAREIAGRYGNPGLPGYKVKKSGIKVNVDSKVRNIRPLIACAVVRGIKTDQNVLSQLIQLQEKIAGTFGRNRKEAAIGVYDMSKIKPPIKYTTTKPDGIKFTPLEMDKPMTPAQILKKHPKGKEFRHLLKDKKEYPILTDSAGEVLSMPPIINSNYTGKVTSGTRDVFVECTGFEERFILPALNSLVAALADRGGKIESVEIISGKKTVTPDLAPKKSSVRADSLNKISGLNLSGKKICTLLNQARMEAKQNKNKIKVRYPAYRQDIMHEVDLIEDVIISYGYNNIEPEVPELATIGSELPLEKLSRTITSTMSGLGAQEIMSYVLTSKKNLFSRMNRPESKLVEIENIISSNWSVMRTSLLPETLEFLSKNKHVEYPQKIFEIGDTVIPDPKAETKTRDTRKLSYAITHKTSGYEDVSSALDAVMRSLDLKYNLKKAEHPSFIKGRCADVLAGKKRIGKIGEISPAVLTNWDLDNPVAAFEINVSEILDILQPAK